MMLVLAGLHGAGKSFISRLLVEEFGWTNIYKRDILHKLHAQSGDQNDWEQWYLRQYQIHGVESVTKDILKVLPLEAKLVLDSVHNPIEWRVIRTQVPESRLMFVLTSLKVREERHGPGQNEINQTRLRHWHEQKEHLLCLAAEADWALNGAAPVELLRLEIEHGLKIFW